MEFVVVLLIVFAPGVLTTQLLKKMKKQTLSDRSYFARVVLYDVLINFLTLLVYRFICHEEESVIVRFNEVKFILFYTMLNIILAIGVAIVGYLISPHVKLSIYSDGTTEKEESENE